jgi:hypothetical protein
LLKVANISISNLQPSGLYLLADSETLIDSMKDLSENELKMTFGGKKSKSKKSKSSSSSCYCPCPPHGGGGGGGQ